MANLKQIAATLAVLGSGAMVFTGCEKTPEATEVPGGGDAPAADTGVEAPAADSAGDAAEAKCGEGHSEEGHCGAAEG